MENYTIQKGHNGKHRIILHVPIEETKDRVQQLLNTMRDEFKDYRIQMYSTVVIDREFITNIDVWNN